MPYPIPPEIAEDTPYGLAQADFPVSVYDRPELMFASALRGDVDGMTRAMLAPDTLSPRQMQDVQSMIMRGKKPDPITKTILEVATNPLVIVGLIAALRYPMASTNAVLAIRKGLLPKAAAMGKMTSGIHGAMMNLRTVPGLYEALLGQLRETKNFIVQQGTKAQAFFREAQALRPLSAGESALVAARLDGLHTTTNGMYKMIHNSPEYIAFMGSKDVPIAAGLQGKMDKRLLSLADKLKGWYKDIWDQTYGNPITGASAAKSAQKKGLRLGGEITDNYLPHQGGFNRYYQQSLRGATGVEYRKHLSAEYERRLGKHAIERSDEMWASRESMLNLERAGGVKAGFVEQVYDPYIRRVSGEASKVAEQIWDDVAKAGLTDAEQRVEFAARMTQYYTKGPGKQTNLIGRLGSKKHVRDTLDAMAGALQEAQRSGGDAMSKELLEIGRTMAAPASYDLDVIKVSERYLTSVGSDYAYHTKGYGKKITDIIQTPGVFDKAPHLESYVVDGILPHVMGYNTFGQMQRTLADATRKMKIVDWIDKHPMVRQTLGDKHTEALLGWLNKPSSLASQSIGGQVANWFHLSTLGLNLSASSANAMQTFLTTINNVGPAGIWRGLNGFGSERGVIARAREYAELLAKGVKDTEAFKRAFPEFVEEVGEWSATTERMLSGDVAKAGYEGLFRAKGVWDKVKAAMMTPFATTEAGNQLLAFYSGRNQHLYLNAAKAGTAALSAEASKVGGALAQLTQFAGGPLGIPKAIMDMNPMWRQYMHFPMRYLSYLHGSLRMGVDPNKLDWGTIGRALAGSTAAYIAARNLAGIDLSRGLMGGALPTPGYEKSPFYPFPFVPPAAGLIGEVGKAVFTGEGESLRSAMATLIPGGVALRRAYRSLSPRYADYENRNPDGTIPLYNEKRSLVGSMTPMELTMRAVGLSPMGVSAEVGASKWLLKQRDRIREYRRRYTQAVADNEPVEAEKINAAFQRAYPELGPIVLKKSDIRAIENRQEFSRIQRVMKGMSREYQPLFENVLAEAGLGQITQSIPTAGLPTLPQ